MKLYMGVSTTGRDEQPDFAFTYGRFFLPGVAVLASVSTLLIAGCAVMLLGGRVGIVNIALAVLATGAITFWTVGTLFPAHHAQMTVVALLGSAVLIVVSICLSAAIYDGSWDGQTYHAEAIIGMANGWNPYRDHAPDGAFFATWLAFFSKGAWINAASLTAATGNVETGKSINLLLMAVSFAFAVPAVTRIAGLRGWKALLIAAIIALNPVSVSQLFTYYIDGQLGSVTAVVVCLLILFDQRPSWLIGVPLVLASVLLISLKLNGAIYLTIIAVGYSVWYWATRRRGGRLLLACGILAYGIGFVVNINPFVTQYAQQVIANGDPFYPTDWAALTQIHGNTPAAFHNKGWLEKFGVSLFSRYRSGLRSTLKIPMTLTIDEILWSYDARFSGFGPYFSGALLFAAAAFVSQIRRGFPALVLVLLGVMGLSILSSPEAWWARYVPQLWLLTILLAIVPSPATSRWTTLWRWLALGTLTVNAILLVLIMVVGVGVSNGHLRGHLVELYARSQAQPILINFRGAALTQAHFDQYGVNYEETTTLPCVQPVLIRLVPSAAIMCRE